MSIEMITTSIIIIILYTMAARALGKLTSDSVSSCMHHVYLVMSYENRLICTPMRQTHDILCLGNEKARTKASDIRNDQLRPATAGYVSTGKLLLLLLCYVLLLLLLLLLLCIIVVLLLCFHR